MTSIVAQAVLRPPRFHPRPSGLSPEAASWRSHPDRPVGVGIRDCEAGGRQPIGCSAAGTTSDENGVNAEIVEAAGHLASTRGRKGVVHSTRCALVELGGRAEQACVPDVSDRQRSTAEKPDVSRELIWVHGQHGSARGLSRRPGARVGEGRRHRPEEHPLKDHSGQSVTGAESANDRG